MFHHCREHQQVSLAGHREETGHTAQAEAVMQEAVGRVKTPAISNSQQTSDPAGQSLEAECSRTD